MGGGVAWMNVMRIVTAGGSREYGDVPSVGSV
jgi:hypothetical protein